MQVRGPTRAIAPLLMQYSIRIPEYKHGLRSMEAILDMTLLSEGETFHLPEKLKEAFRREADKKMAQHDSSDE